MNPTDHLDEIRTRHKAQINPEKIMPFDDITSFAQAIKDRGWLLDEVDRLRTDGLKVTGIPLKGKVR